MNLVIDGYEAAWLLECCRERNAIVSTVSSGVTGPFTLRLGMRNDPELMVLKVVPTTATGLFRTTSACEPVTTLDTRPNDRCAHPGQTYAPTAQKRRVPYELRHPRQRAHIHRQSDVQLLDAGRLGRRGPPGCGIGRGPAHVDGAVAHRASSASPTLCCARLPSLAGGYAPCAHGVLEIVEMRRI